MPLNEVKLPSYWSIKKIIQYSATYLRCWHSTAADFLLFYAYGKILTVRICCKLPQIQHPDSNQTDTIHGVYTEGQNLCLRIVRMASTTAPYQKLCKPWLHNGKKGRQENISLLHLSTAEHTWWRRRKPIQINRKATMRTPHTVHCALSLYTPIAAPPAPRLPVLLSYFSLLMNHRLYPSKNPSSSNLLTAGTSDERPFH